MKQDFLVLDIETTPHRLDEYKTLFPNSKKKGGLHAIISEAVAVGLGDSGGITILDRQNHDTEKDILVELSEMLVKAGLCPVVSYNGKAFDIPFLRTRAMLHGISMPLPDNRSVRNVDLYADFLGGKWQSDISSCSLRELVWFMYGEKPQTESGSHVAELYASGKLEEIADHCREDVEWTRRLYVDFAASK